MQVEQLVLIRQGSVPKRIVMGTFPMVRKRLVNLSSFKSTENQLFMAFDQVPSREAIVESWLPVALAKAS